MEHDIHLRYMFTDRGGSQVFDAFHADDRLGQHERLFRIRINGDTYAKNIQWAEIDDEET